MSGYALPLSLLLIVIGAVGAVVYFGRKAAARRLADAREEAQRWYDRLGGQIMNLSAEGDPAARQALADAGERYNAAGAQLERAATRRQYDLAGQTALEGLFYVRAAREALGLDAGPELPPLEGQSRAGSLTDEIGADVEGRHLTGAPKPDGRNRYYHPGGTVKGRSVPAGWYSEQWWKPALIGGAAALGTILVFDALIMPAMMGGSIEGAYGEGYADGAGDAGGDAGGDFGGGDFGGGDFGGGDF